MTEENGKTLGQSARIERVENEISSLNGEVSSLKGEFKALGNTVKSLGDDLAASDRKQEQHHAEAMRRQEQFQKEWRDQKDAERREQDQAARQRQLGPVQVLQMAAAGAGFMAVAFGGFFFLIKAYVDGSLTPQITQLTERQNATSESAVVRNGIIDNIRTQAAEQAAGLAEITRVSNDNRARLIVYADRIRDLEIDAARRDERQKADAEIRDLQHKSEKEMREMADKAIMEPK